jgi:hypothetical protein
MSLDDGKWFPETLSTYTKVLHLPETRQTVVIQAQKSSGQASEALCPILQQ